MPILYLLNMFKKINAWLHLWLGLASGIIVVIVSLTGCILVFESEIKDILNTGFSVEAQDESQLLPPSKLHAAVSAFLPEKEIHSIWYHGLTKAAVVNINSDSVIYINPYTAEILSFQNKEDIFHFIDEGHRNLWMGKKVGKQIVGWGTMVFFFLLLTGLILWWPKKWNQRHRNQSFKIKWKARFKRLNYDLHNVLGFYILLFALLLAITGLIISFSWFSKSVYWLTGGDGNPVKGKKEVFQNSPHTFLYNSDQVWYKVRNDIAHHNRNDIIISFQDEANEPIYACTDMIKGTWRDLFFNPVDLSLTQASSKEWTELKFPDQLRRMNYSLHVGSFGGMPTKIFFFFISLICASLPITGFYIWWGKRP